jgi:hypothetical protein
MEKKKRVSRAEKREMFFKFLKEQEISFFTENFCNYLIVTYSKHSVFYVAIFGERDTKPYIHSYFKTIELREGYITEQKKLYQCKYDIQQKELLELQSLMDSVCAGTIFYASWGCEQTNVQFYIVVERKKSFLLLQEIEKIQYNSPGFNDRGVCVPNENNKIGNPFKKKLTLYGIRLESYKTARIYEKGKKLSWSSYA